MAVLVAVVLATFVVVSQAQFGSRPRQNDPSTPDANGSMDLQMSNDTGLIPPPPPPQPDLGHLLMDLIGLAKQLSTDLPEGRPHMLPPWKQESRDRIARPDGDQNGDQQYRVYEGRPIDDSANSVAISPMRRMDFNQGSSNGMDRSSLPEHIRFSMMGGNQMKDRMSGFGGMQMNEHPLAMMMMAHRMDMMQSFRRPDSGGDDDDQDDNEWKPRGPSGHGGLRRGGRGGRGGESNDDDDDQEGRRGPGSRDDDNEGPRGRGRPHFPRPDREDDNEDRGERGHGGRPHGRPSSRPDREDDDNSAERGGPRGNDDEDREGRPGRRRPHFGPRDDDDDNEGPMSRRGGRDSDRDGDDDREGRPERRRHHFGPRDGDDDDEPRRFGGRFGMFKYGKREQGDDDKPDFDRRDEDRDGEDDGDDQEEVEGRGRPEERGNKGHGGRRHKKPDCKKVIRFLLWKLRHQRGGRGEGRGGRGGRGPQGFDGANKNEGFGRDDSDSNNDMIFPRRSPFSFESDEE